MSDQEARREEEVGTEEAQRAKVRARRARMRQTPVMSHPQGEGDEEGLKTEEVKARRAKMRQQLTAILDNPIAGYQIEKAGIRGEDAIDWFFGMEI